MLFETPIWIVWCGVASVAFIVGFGWGLLVNMPDKLRFGKREVKGAI